MASSRSPAPGTAGATFAPRLTHALASALALASCGEPPPPAPSVVIEVAPTWVCRGDAHATEVTLDASASQPRLTLVPVPPEPSEPPLALDWSLAGSEFRLIEGDLHSAVLRLTLAADRPLHVVLRARNGEGGTASARRSVAIADCEAQ